MENSKQHFQLPNKMGLSGLKPKDQLVYVCLRSFMNNKTMEAFPSLEKLSDKIGTTIPTIRASIKRLVEKNYISIRKDGRKNIYKFNKLVEYEPFSPEFLENENISFNVKAFITATQQYMFKDVEGLGKISFSNRELAKQINLPESSIRKCNQELQRNHLMDVFQNTSRDIESGCKTETKIYRLKDLGQAIVWKLGEHEERIANNEQRSEDNAKEITKLQNELISQRKLIQSLYQKLDDLTPNDKTYTM